MRQFRDVIFPIAQSCDAHTTMEHIRSHPDRLRWVGLCRGRETLMAREMHYAAGREKEFEAGVGHIIEQLHARHTPSDEFTFLKDKVKNARRGVIEPMTAARGWCIVSLKLSTKMWPLAFDQRYLPHRTISRTEIRHCGWEMYRVVQPVIRCLPNSTLQSRR
jgi:hypothetical protein